MPGFFLHAVTHLIAFFLAVQILIDAFVEYLQAQKRSYKMTPRVAKENGLLSSQYKSSLTYGNKKNLLLKNALFIKVNVLFVH